LTAVTFAVSVLARMPMRNALTRLAPLVSFVILAFGLLLILPVPPETPTVALPLLRLRVSEPGLRLVTAVAVKSSLVVLAVTAMAAGLSQRELLEGLVSLGLPARFRSLCYLMVRQLEGVRGEVRRMAQARDARGRPKRLRAVRVAGAMAQVLIVRLGRRSEAQAFALVARGFRGSLSLLEPRRLTVAEWSVLAFCGVLLVLVARL
jgi:energy-coupling factor transporter transmembrane protein EcfT